MHNARFKRFTTSAVVTRQTELIRHARGSKRYSGPQGRFYNLEEVFDSLNPRFFGGLLGRPELTWSEGMAKHSLGHYDAAHNTIVVSRVFDRPSSPRYAIEYLLYHEMLHLKHPVRMRASVAASTPANSKPTKPCSQICTKPSPSSSASSTRQKEAHGNQCACFGRCGSFCLISFVKSRQNAGFRAELVIPAEGHVVDHRFEVAIQAEDHAPLVEFAFGAAAGDLYAPLGTDIGLATQFHRTVLHHDLRPDEGHVRVPFFVEIRIDHDAHDGPAVGVDREFAVGVGLVSVESGPVTLRKAAIRELGRGHSCWRLSRARQSSVLAAFPRFQLRVLGLEAAALSPSHFFFFFFFFF